MLLQLWGTPPRRLVEEVVELGHGQHPGMFDGERAGELGGITLGTAGEAQAISAHDHKKGEGGGGGETVRSAIELPAVQSARGNMPTSCLDFYAARCCIWSLHVMLQGKPILAIRPKWGLLPLHKQQPAFT